MIPKVKLAILISYYQDMRCLDKALHSLHNFAFATPQWFSLCAILMDGRYKGFASSQYSGVTSSRHVHEMIHDHLTTMCSEYDNGKTHRFSYVHRIPAMAEGSIPERYKRQTLMDMAARAGCDFALVLDSDEYLDSERRHGASMWPQFANELKFIKYQHPVKYHIYGVRFVDWGRPVCHRPRLFAHPEHVRYTEKHYTFNFSDEPRLNVISPLTIYHKQNECRPQARLQDSDLYRQKIAWLE